MNSLASRPKSQRPDGIAQYQHCFSKPSETTNGDKDPRREWCEYPVGEGEGEEEGCDERGTNGRARPEGISATDAGHIWAVRHEKFEREGAVTGRELKTMGWAIAIEPFSAGLDRDGKEIDRSCFGQR